MVFDAHDRAFALFKGICSRGIYDNMKTAVETIFVGKGRLYNRRFLQMCSHYLVDPVACTPASGWKKGQVENQVGLVRERFFTTAERVGLSSPIRTLRITESAVKQCISVDFKAAGKDSNSDPHERRLGYGFDAGKDRLAVGTPCRAAAAERRTIWRRAHAC